MLQTVTICCNLLQNPKTRSVQRDSRLIASIGNIFSQNLVRKSLCQTLTTEDLFCPVWNSAMRSIIRERLAEIRSDHPSIQLTECVSEVLEGKVYKLNDIAKLWNCSHEFVRRQFIHEPGVIHSGGMYLIPKCVVERVVVRLMIR